MTSGELASMVGGTLVGPGDLGLTGIDVLDRAGPAQLSFLRDAQYAPKLKRSRCGAVLVSRRVFEDSDAAAADNHSRAMIFVDDADLALITLLEKLTPPPAHPVGIHARATVDPSAHIGEGVAIGPNAVVGAQSTIDAGAIIYPGVVIGTQVSIGERSIVYANVTIQDRCVIGSRCNVHSGVVIGTDGFGYRPDAGGNGLIKIPHAGNVIIGDDVEIGANTCIDRAKFGATLVGDGTKIDNHVQIGHGCRIGTSCILCGGAALAGSVTLGDGVTLAGEAAVADNNTLGAGATLGARSGLFSDIPAGKTWFGYPARPATRAFRSIASLDQLPELVRKVRRIIADHDRSR